MKSPGQDKDKPTKRVTVSLAEENDDALLLAPTLVREMTAVGMLTKRTETSTNLSIPTGFVLLEKPVSLERLRVLVKERVLQKPGFMERMCATVGDDGHFVQTPNMSWYEENLIAYKNVYDAHSHWHVTHGGAQTPRADSNGVELWSLHDEEDAQHDEETQLQAFMGRVMSRDLDQSRPLWQLILLEDYKGGSCIVVRLHHCIADGMGMGSLFTALSDEGLPALPPPPQPETLGQYVGQVVQCAVSLAMFNLTIGVSLLMVFLKWMYLVCVCGKPALLKTERAVRGSGRRVLCWDSTLSVERMKAAGKRKGRNLTLNDVALSIIMGGMRKYLNEKSDALVEGGGAGPDPDTVLVAVPINLRGGGGLLELRNKFGFAVVGLPLSTKRLLDTSKHVHNAMLFSKRWSEGYASYLMTFALAFLSKFSSTVVAYVRWGMAVCAQRVTLCVSNVPGPPSRLRLDGVEVTNCMGFIPPPPGCRIGVGICSYAGKVNMTVATDAAVITDPEHLLQLIVGKMAEFE